MNTCFPDDWANSKLLATEHFYCCGAKINNGRYKCNFTYLIKLHLYFPLFIYQSTIVDLLLLKRSFFAKLNVLQKALKYETFLLIPEKEENLFLVTIFGSKFSNYQTEEENSLSGRFFLKILLLFAFFFRGV